MTRAVGMLVRCLGLSACSPNNMRNRGRGPRLRMFSHTACRAPMHRSAVRRHREEMPMRKARLDKRPIDGNIALPRKPTANPQNSSEILREISATHCNFFDFVIYYL